MEPTPEQLQKLWEREQRRREAQAEFAKTPEGKAYNNERARNFYARHKEEILQKRKAYYEKNKDKLITRMKTYYEAHKQEIRNRKKRTEKNTPDVIECLTPKNSATN